jgi:hypothetical protein
MQLVDILVTGKAVRGFILANWLNEDGPEKARERLQLAMQLLADGVMTPPKGSMRGVCDGGCVSQPHCHS